MQTSDRGRALIRQHEGLRLEAYQDPVGVWTIGFGHTSAAGPPAVYKGMRITAAGADEILRTDLRKFEGYVASAVKVPLNQNQFDALVSFTLNLGSENLRSSTLLKRLNAGDYFGAADQFAVWNRAGGKVLPGLVKRRAAERALFLEPDTSPRPPSKPTPAPQVPLDAPDLPPMAWAAIAVGLLIVAAMILGG